MSNKKRSSSRKVVVPSKFGDTDYAVNNKKGGKDRRRSVEEKGDYETKDDTEELNTESMAEQEVVKGSEKDPCGEEMQGSSDPMVHQVEEIGSEKNDCENSSAQPSECCYCTMSDYLPQELVVRIFTKLPVKSLLLFRILSKSWCSLISSPDFIRKYTLGLVKTTKKVLIMNNIMGGKDIYTLHQEDQLPLSSGEGYLGVTAVEFPNVEVQIAGSCNGILFLVDMLFGMCLWNFSVRRQLMIPRHPLQSRSTKMTVGFGFDPITNDYKIMTIHYGDTLRPYLYTLNSASWSPIAPPATMFYHLRCNSCLIDKTLHWVASESPDIPYCVIMTFDLSTHVFGRISLPEPSWEFEQLGEFNGSLAVMCTKGNDPWIWVKTESNHVPSWSVFLKLESPKFQVGPILQPTSNGDLLIHIFPDYATHRDDKVYNCRTGVLSTLSRFRGYCNIRMVTYVESLELLDRGTPCGETIKWSEKKKHK